MPRHYLPSAPTPEEGKNTYRQRALHLGASSVMVFFAVVEKSILVFNNWYCLEGQTANVQKIGPEKPAVRDDILGKHRKGVFTGAMHGTGSAVLASAR